MLFEPPLPTKEELAKMEEYFRTNLELAKKNMDKKAIQRAMRDYVIFKVLLSTGRRLGEILNVRVREIDFRNNIMYTIIEKERKRRRKKGQYELDDREWWELERRPIGFPPSIAGLLKEYIEIMELKPNDYLFPVSARYVQRRFEQARKATGIKKRIVPHSLRVFVITELINRGWSLERIRRITGHKDPRTILRYDRGTYFAEKEQYEREISDVIEEIEGLASRLW